MDLSPSIRRLTGKVGFRTLSGSLLAIILSLC